MKRLYLILAILLIPALVYAYTVGTPSNMVPANWAAYAVDPGASDSGVTSTSQVTLKNLVTDVGTTKKATIIFPHTGSGTTTQYTIGTALDLSSYSNITFQIENGAQLKVSDGVSGVTFPSQGSIKAQPNQQIMSGTSLFFANAGGTASVRWFGANPDGSGDDNTSLQTALNSVKGGGDLLIPSGTSYYTTSATLVSGNTNTRLIFEKGAEIWVSGVSTTLLTLSAPNQVVDGGKFTGYGSYQTSGTGGASLVSAVSPHITIQNCHFVNPEQQAIYVSGTTCTIDNNLIEGGKVFATYAEMGSDRQHYGINVAANSHGGKATRNTIKENATTGGRQIEGIVMSVSSHGWTVSNNTVGDCYDHGLYLGVQGSTVSNNVLTGCGIKVQMPIYASGNKGNTVIGNTIDVNDTTALGDNGITLTNAFGSTVANNIIRRAADYGISITSSSTPYMITDNVIIGNVINYVNDAASENSVGIAVDQSGITTFARNIIAINTISNLGADGATVDGDQFGIYINVASGTSDHIGNIISTNTIKNSQEGGIYILNLTDSIISKNYIEGMGSGGTPFAAIEVESLNRSKVQDNIIIGGVSTSYGYREDIPGHGNEIRNNTILNAATAPMRYIGMGDNLIEGTQIGNSGITRYSINADRTVGYVELFNHTHLRDPNGDNRTDTFPTAAQIIQNVLFGDGNKVDLHYINSGDTETITLAFGSGCTVYNSGGGGTFVLNPYHSAKLTFINDSGTTVFVLGTVY